MSRINILPEILSNKIAAGEVVERPASVVKELVENGLDAGSRRITVEVRQGGKSLIRISDDGIGMGHDDALLALERYATSKIRKDQDLYDIRTLGFRGEALPSIAAVSRFSVTTREKEADVGTEITVKGGRILNVAETGAPPGTMITVKQLFFNTPARKKFLKSVNTEMGHVADTLAGIAMGWPTVHFRLIHNDRVVKRWSAAPDPKDRVADILGREVRGRLYPIDFENRHLSISGWLAASAVNRSTTRGIYVYVNGRFVRDRVIRHGLMEGYRGRLMKGRFPVAVIFITLPFDQVDVNVHPTKHEVRFVHQKTVHDAIADTVRQTLETKERPAWQEPPLHETIRVPEERIRTQTETAPFQKWERPGNGLLHQIAEPVTFMEKQPALSPEPVETRNDPQNPLWEKSRFSDARIIGQFHNTYVLCEVEGALLIIDQHAAHERIVYEQLKNRSRAHKPPVQQLLMPETMELGYREADAMQRLIEDLAGIGFEIEPFGGNTFVVKSVPAIFAGREVVPMVTEIVENAVEMGFATGTDKIMDRSLILMACHSAVRANLSLEDREIRKLLDDLDRCDDPSHCPHGRPTWIRWTARELEKAFHRIV